MINVAVLGLGYMGQNHVRVLSSITNVNVIAICDKDPIKIATISKQYKIKPYKNYLKLINDEKLLESMSKAAKEKSSGFSDENFSKKVKELIQ